MFLEPSVKGVDSWVPLQKRRGSERLKAHVNENGLLSIREICMSVFLEYPRERGFVAVMGEMRPTEL